MQESLARIANQNRCPGAVPGRTFDTGGAKNPPALEAPASEAANGPQPGIASVLVARLDRDESVHRPAHTPAGKQVCQSTQADRARAGNNQQERNNHAPRQQRPVKSQPNRTRHGNRCPSDTPIGSSVDSLTGLRRPSGSERPTRSLRNGVYRHTDRGQQPPSLSAGAHRPAAYWGRSAGPPTHTGGGAEGKDATGSAPQRQDRNSHRAGQLLAPVPPGTTRRCTGPTPSAKHPDRGPLGGKVTTQLSPAALALVLTLRILARLAALGEFKAGSARLEGVWTGD